MKKAFIVSIIACVAFVSCLSTGETTTKEQLPEGVDKVIAVDWDGRVLGEPSAPNWLKQINKGNATLFKEEFGVDSNRVCRISKGEGKTQALAETFSRVNFTYQQAEELQQKVIARAGVGINSAGQREALFNAASQTKVDMTGLRTEASFWQKIRTTNSQTGSTTESFIHYTIYSMSSEIWASIVRKYLMDVMGDANLQTETQKTIGGLFSEIKDDEDKISAKKQADDEKAYNLQKKQLEVERAKAAKEAAQAKTDEVIQKIELKRESKEEAQARADAERATILSKMLL
ncbi:MAG: hypothetical protein ACRC5H_00625 [Treponemataceae bacterium]